MKNYSGHVTIKQWAEEDRPREKLLLKGRHSLSDAELLAVLIGSGTKGQSALEIAREILSGMRDNLVELGRISLSDLMKYKGVGMARAVCIAAALELGKRRNEAVVVEKEQIHGSREAFQVFKAVMGDQPYEEFWIILLNKANRVLGKKCISEGGISGTVVDPKKIFKIALDHHATSIILGHNHPSGNPEPSDSDWHITKRVVEAGRMLEVLVVDHIIVADDQYFSFLDKGSM